MATVTFVVNTKFTPDDDDAEEHNGIHDLAFTMNTDGGTVVDGSVSSTGLTYNAGSNTFAAHATGTDVLPPQTYVITEKLDYATRGVKHPILAGTATLTDTGSKTTTGLQNVTIPAGALEIHQGTTTIPADAKDTTGGFVQLNDDFDNGTSTPDLGKMTTPAEDDLLPLTMKASGAGGRYQLEFTDSGAGQDIKIWAKPDKSAADASTHIVGGTGGGATYRIGNDKTIFNASVDTTVYVEGVQAGAAADEIKLRWKDDPTTAPYNVADQAKVTVVNSEVDAKTIKDNAVVNELTGFDKQKTGSFLPLNNDDDDYADYDPVAGKADKDQTGAITGEDDLLPVVLHKVGGADAGNYRLTIPANVKVWKNADRTGAVDATTDIPANVDTTVYVEGVQTGGNDLKAEWKNGTAAFVNADHIKVTTFGWSGALNVPGYATYEYKATDALAGSKWVTPVSGMIKSGANTSDATIFWDGASPVVGKAVYQVNTSYQWDLEVNVVQIEFSAAGNISHHADKAVNPPTQLGGANGTVIEASDAINAMTSQIALDDVVGPTVNGVQRGRRFMEIGHVHQAQFVEKYGRYLTIGKNRQSKLQDGSRHWDAADGATVPWTFKDADHYLDITADDQVVAGHKFASFDNPKLAYTDQFVISGDQVDEVHLIMKHWTYIAVRTKDASVIDATNPLTQLAKLEWQADSSGTINAAGVYSPTGAGTTVDPQYTLATDGSRVPDASPNINELFAAEDWDTK